MDPHSTVGTGGAIAMIVAMFAIAVSAELINYLDNKENSGTSARSKGAPETGDSDSDEPS